MPTIHDALRKRLREYKQEHTLAFFDTLDDAARQRLLAQLEALDFDLLSRLYASGGKTYAVPSADTLGPVPVIPHDSSDNSARKAQGEEALRQGKVTVLLVAGGQGSRLGFEKPKGMFPVGPVSKKSLFAVHAEKVLALSQRYGVQIPFLVMTSPATHDDTLEFFEQHNNFGLAAVSFFCQASMPALDIATGRLLLESPGQIFLSPDGHGGTLTALAKSGLLAELAEDGIEQVFYLQVDNALVKIADPTFLGHHLHAHAEVSSKIVAKCSPQEKVGVFAQVNGRCMLVEYSDLPKELAAQTDENGRLRLWAGNPAIHIFAVDFLQRMTRDEEGIPFHVAKKKVPHIDAEGKPVDPQTENALKFERFIFDVLPKAERWTVVETLREQEFAPLKNATGDDSPATAEALMCNLAAAWVRRAGGEVTTGAKVEISPLYALDAEELAAKLPAGTRVEGERYFD